MVCSKTKSLPSPTKQLKRKRMNTPVKRRNIRYKPSAKVEEKECQLCEFTSMSKVKLMKHVKMSHSQPKLKASPVKENITIKQMTCQSVN